MRRALLLFLVFFIAGCGSGEEFPEQRASAERYLEYQKAGDWKKLCQMLSPEEKRRIKEALGSECAQAISGDAKLADTLQSRVQGAQIGPIKKSGQTFQVSVGSDSLWIRPEGIYLQKP